LIILDEIDKCSADRYDPLAALYSLLETETAARFQDQSLPEILMDLSRVRFFCTANRIDRIPEPLLTRLTVFEIDRPSADQLRGVLRSMFRRGHTARHVH
jgi:ATP-dependent Lon protease